MKSLEDTTWDLPLTGTPGPATRSLQVHTAPSTGWPPVKSEWRGRVLNLFIDPSALCLHELQVGCCTSLLVMGVSARKWIKQSHNRTWGLLGYEKDNSLGLCVGTSLSSNRNSIVFSTVFASFYLFASAVLNFSSGGPGSLVKESELLQRSRFLHSFIYLSVLFDFLKPCIFISLYQ